jgi:hypothetical protein
LKEGCLFFTSAISPKGLVALYTVGKLSMSKDAISPKGLVALYTVGKPSMSKGATCIVSSYGGEVIEY